LAGLILGTSSSGHTAGQDLEIWLLEGTDCGTCELYQRFHQGYPTQLTDHTGANAPIPVSVVSKTAIPDVIADQFTPHDYWPHSLSVMVLDDGKVL
jgi:hypothetical protein